MENVRIFYVYENFIPKICYIILSCEFFDKRFHHPCCKVFIALKNFIKLNPREQKTSLLSPHTSAQSSEPLSNVQPSTLIDNAVNAGFAKQNVSVENIDIPIQDALVEGDNFAQQDESLEK